MPQKYKIKYTPIAVDDMDEIFSYISKNNIVGAETLLKKITEGITRLAEFPNMGSG
ncbi:MAG TPA: type II toxin-antitoxin system mRNA interferase toxin, RelE/StbE family, partial [Desulfotomaculum sp.]|nr:type II toxin-antitoxin system mRNA interferase toxin, RelE/StbE family [Desulfotomaculum sp.]